MLEAVMSAIKPLNEAAMEKCQARLDNLTKPLGSLHAFEHLARKMSGITGNPRPGLLSPRIVLVNGSHRTKGMLDVFAGHVLAEIDEFEVGDGFYPDAMGLMQIVERGTEISLSATRAGSRVIGIGMVGTLTPSIVSEIQSWYCKGDEEPLDILTRMESPELAGMVGVILGAASGGAAVVLDDLSTSTAALVAVRMIPQVKEYLVGSHFAAERHHAEGLKLMNLPAYLYLGMNVGEGVGAALGISLIQASIHVLNDMKTFGEAEVHVAEDGPGALVQSPDVRD